MLCFASSSSALPDTRKAARGAIREALDTVNARDVRVVVVHATMGHDPSAAAQAIREAVPGARVVGCSCAGVIGRDGANESMRALALMAVAGDEGEVSVASCDGFNGETSRARSVELASAVIRDTPRVQAAMLIAPGIDVAIDDAIEGLESVFGQALPIFGGTASDNMKGLATWQCVDGQVYERAAFVLGFADESLRLEMQATHGFVPAGVEFEVTHATGNRVHTLDGEPAWRAYTRGLGLHESVTPAETIPPGAVGVRLSEEVAREYGDSHLLRVITHREADGTILMPVTCPVGTRLSLMRRDEERIFANLAVTMGQLRARIGDREPVAVFHTDCGARGRLMLDRVSKDEIVADMQRPLFGGKCGPWLGMYGFGEITSLGGRNVFHNYTSSLYVLSRRTG